MAEVLAVCPCVVTPALSVPAADGDRNRPAQFRPTVAPRKPGGARPANGRPSGSADAHEPRCRAPARTAIPCLALASPPSPASRVTDAASPTSTHSRTYRDGPVPCGHPPNALAPSPSTARMAPGGGRCAEARWGGSGTWRPIWEYRSLQSSQRDLRARASPHGCVERGAACHAAEVGLRSSGHIARSSRVGTRGHCRALHLLGK
jgi:hypothetical protein